MNDQLCNQELNSMVYKFGEHSRAGRSTGPYRLIWPILLVASVAGCAAMEGVNVGANIPIGGVNVGANKTIGEGQAPAKREKKPREKPDEAVPQEE